MRERDLIDNKINLNISNQDFLKLAHSFMFDLTKMSLKIISFLSPALAARLSWKLFSTPRLKKSPRQSFLKLAQVEYLDHKGHKISTYIHNPQGSETILLVHGWEGQASDFNSLLLSLLDHRFKVISFDAPAHGLSEKKRTHAIDFSQIIQALAKKHGNFKAIISHSMGGFASSHALAHSPEAISEKLITIGAPNKLTTIIHNFISFMELGYQTELELLKYIEKRFKLRTDQASTAQYAQMAAKTQKLFVHDEYDRQVPIERLDELLEFNPTAKTLKTYSLGHNRILRDSSTIKKIVDFLNS